MTYLEFVSPLVLVSLWKSSVCTADPALANVLLTCKKKLTILSTIFTTAGIEFSSVVFSKHHIFHAYPMGFDTSSSHTYVMSCLLLLAEFCGRSAQSAGTKPPKAVQRAGGGGILFIGHKRIKPLTLKKKHTFKKEVKQNAPQDSFCTQPMKIYQKTVEKKQNIPVASPPPPSQPQKIKKAPNK